MKRWGPLFTILSFLPVTGAVAQKVQNEGLVRELGPGWTSMYEISRDARYNAVELVPNGYSLSDWEEIVRIADFSGESKESAVEPLKKQQAIAEKKCPGTVHWSVIASDETGVMFRRHYDPCGNLPEEDEVGRVIVGRYSRYILEYSSRVHELAPDTRSRWIALFSNATFDSVTASLDPEWMSVDVDEAVAYPMDKVMDALEIGMETQTCQVVVRTAERIECKRPRSNDSHSYDLGGESVTGVLEATGGRTHVRITTGLGLYGRLAKKNWSTPVFEAMLRGLRQISP